jgi:hypothetical protein
MPVKFCRKFSFVALVIMLFCRQIMMDSECTKPSYDREIGKKLPISQFMVLYEVGLQMCFRECEAYTICLSLNFNRKMLLCELNSQKANDSLSLVNDNDFIYRDIPNVVSIVLY